jgi:hypothetical protein
MKSDFPSSKVCVRCHIEKPISEFTKRPTCRDGYDTTCKSCKSELTKIYYATHKDYVSKKYKEYYAKNKELLLKKGKEYREANKQQEDDYHKKYYQEHKVEEKARSTKKLYGLEYTDYLAMLENQNGVCAICHEAPDKRNLNIDHNHETGEIRGLLCIKCNRAIGLMKDDINLFQSAIEYLQRGDKK